MQFLDFEKPVADLDAKIQSLKELDTHDSVGIAREIEELENKSQKILQSIFSNLTDWQVIRLARHPDRPYGKDYIEHVFDDFVELHGDRAFSDDLAVIGGMAKLDGTPVMVIAQQKGRNTKEKIRHNFGMMHPEGYRKALRLMKLAEKFNMPVITLIDTPGAYPGVKAEERGQSEAIARNLLEMSTLSVPIVCLVIGEGCSGGALGIGVGDVFMMMQYSYFATISPEGCASILWKSAEKAEHAAEIMGITAEKLRKNGLIDQIVPEPFGGAHRNPIAAAQLVKTYLKNALTDLQAKSIPNLLDERYQKLTSYGDVMEI